jgi:hypothetical protein
METFMVVLPIGSLTDFVTELNMSIIGNSSLQHAERAMISASIVDRAVSVCSLDDITGLIEFVFSIKFSIMLKKSIPNRLDNAIIHTYAIHCFKQVVKNDMKLR